MAPYLSSRTEPRTLPEWLWTWAGFSLAEALGDLDDAGTLLDSVRRRYIDKGYLPEATLATLQLSWIRARQGRKAEAFELSATLTEA